MSLKIYGFSRSRAFRSIWMAEEIKAAKGQDFEHDGRFFGDGELKNTLLQLNPMGQVPVIDDDGFVLAESMAINCYLAKKYGVLAPTSLEQEAKALQWSFWVMTAVETAALDYLNYAFGIMGAEIDEEKAAEVAQKFERPFGVLENHLKNSPYLVGDEFTVADLNVAGVFMWVASGEGNLDAYPMISKWLQSCLGRQAALDARSSE